MRYYVFHTAKNKNFSLKYGFFLKKNTKMFGGIKKTSYLCTRKKQKASFNDADKHCKTHNIGVWCNGNTADSGPAFSGSSPDTPTQNG